MAEKLEARSDFLIAENQKDLEFAKAKGVASAMLDRIALDPGRVRAMAQGLRDVAALPDPVREVVKMWRRPNGLQVGRMRIPLGVIGMIYEARPNVTADAAALCLKSGNAVILRGGSEAHHSNQAIGAVLREACAETRVPPDAVQVVQVKDHALVNELLQLEEYIDLIIPRGGEDLIRAVVANSKIPVIKHYKGICHVYVDSDASLADGRADLFQRQGAAAVGVQRHGDSVGSRSSRGAILAGDDREVSSGQGRGARLRQDPRAGAGHQASHRRQTGSPSISN